MSKKLRAYLKKYALFLCVLCSSDLVSAQALPETGHDRIRLTLGESVRQLLINTGIASNDPRIDKTLERIGDQYKDAANNPRYETSSARWAWIGFRVMQRANPWISIALEICAYYYSCNANPKTDITEIKEKDIIVPNSTYSAPFPITPSGFVFYADKIVPLAAFKCGGSDDFILNAELYWPGLGSPCRVKAGKPSALAAHEEYLRKNFDYFGYAPGTFKFDPAVSIDQITEEISHICDYIFTSKPSRFDIANNPYFPCITKARDYTAEDVYYLAPNQPSTWDIIVFTKSGKSIRVVTDAQIGDFEIYPDAPPKGEIKIQPWSETLTIADKQPALSPEWISQTISASWREAEKDPNYDGLPYPYPWGIPTEEIEPLIDQPWWPTIDDLFDPTPDNNWTPRYRFENKPSPLKTYKFTWDCGFLNAPKCLIRFFFEKPDSSIDQHDIVRDPFDPFSIDQITPLNPFLAFLNQRFKGSSCTPYTVSSVVNNKTIVINWDFCKVANVARDVLALLAYFMTAGFIVGSINYRSIKK
jgi:hypothetical protein